MTKLPPLEVTLFVVGAILFGGAFTAILLTQGPDAFSGSATQTRLTPVSIAVENFAYAIHNGTVNADGTVVNLDAKPMGAVTVTITAYDAHQHALDHQVLGFDGVLQPGQRWPFHASFYAPEGSAGITTYAAEATGRGTAEQSGAGSE